MNLGVVLKMFGISAADVEDVKKVGKEAAEKAHESYERLKRIETRVEELHERMSYLFEIQSGEIQNAGKTEQRAIADQRRGSDAGTD